MGAQILMCLWAVLVHAHQTMFLLINLFLSSSSHSQRRDAPAGSKQRSQEQWRSQNKALLKKGEEDEHHGLQAVPKGSCQSMCSSRELREREMQNRLHRFEMLPGTERDRVPRGDPLRAVKEYTRPAAGKDSTNPSGLRPPDVLLKTVHYLIDDIAAAPHLNPWTEASILMLSQSPCFCFC